MGGSLKDRLGAILSVLGFIIICIVYVRMRAADGGMNEKMFDPYGYYVPEQRSDVNEQLIYREYNLGRLNNCKQTELTQAKTIALTGIKGNKDIKCFILSGTDYTIDPSKTNVIPSTSSEIGIISTSSDAVKIYGELVDTSHFTGATADKIVAVSSFNEEYFNANYSDRTVLYELVAPFPFKFQNVNNSGTIDNKEIIIVSSDGKYRITYSKVANWFCAGEPGEPSSYEADNADACWLNHTHQTIVGNSGNSKVRSGSAGAIVGYGDNYTTILCEEKSGDSWKKIKFVDMLPDS